MTYHLPIDLHWNPTSVCETLRSYCVDARACGTSVRIRLPDGARITFFARLWRLLLLRRPKIISMNYDPTKFIRNVEVRFPWPLSRAELRCRDDVDAAMLKIGCLKGCDHEIAARYCPEDATLETLFDEIARLHDEAFKCAQVHDFANASVHMDEQELNRKRIDAILVALVLGRQ